MSNCEATSRANDSVYNLHVTYFDHNWTSSAAGIQNPVLNNHDQLPILIFDFSGQILTLIQDVIIVLFLNNNKLTIICFSPHDATVVEILHRLCDAKTVT